MVVTAFLSLICLFSQLGTTDASEVRYSNHMPVKRLIELADSFVQINPPLCIEYAREALDQIQSPDDPFTAQAYNYISKAYKYQSEYDSTYEYAKKALNACKKESSPECVADALNNIGNAWVGFQNYPQALPFYLESLQIREHTGNLTGQAICIYNLGVIYEKLYEKRLALKYFFHSLRLDSITNNKEGMAFDLNKIGQVYLSLGIHDSAMYCINRARSIFSEHNSPDNLAYALLSSGDILFHQNSYEDASSKYQEALIIFRQTENKEGIILSYQCLGLSNKYQLNYLNATRFYHSALKIAESIGHTESIACIYSNLGSVFQSWINYPKSLVYFHNALRLYTGLKNVSAISNNCNKIGSVYLDLHQYDSAEYYCLKALEVQEKFRELPVYSSILHNLGNIQKKRCNPLRALKYYQESLMVDLELEDKRRLSLTYYNIGQLFRDLHNVNDAEQNLLKSLKYSIKFNFKDIEKDIRLELSNLYENTGKFSDALKYYKDYVRMNDSIFTLEVHKQIMDLQTKYEADKKQQKIGHMNLQQELQDAEIRKQRSDLTGAFIIIALTIGLTIITAFLYTKKNRTFKALVEKNIGEAQKDMYESTLKNEIISTQTNSPLQEKQFIRIKEELDQLIYRKAVFMNNGITLGELAREINTNSNYLSQVINTYYGKNFASFINELRIKEARKLLTNDTARRLTIEGIAISVGFNNRTSFISAFKRYTGVTPTFYHKSVSGMAEHNPSDKTA